MLVGNRMTKHPVTIGPDELLSAAKTKMEAGRFRRLPVVTDGTLVGIITERDLREHIGHFNQVKINGVMTDKPITIAPGATVEEAAQILLKRQIGGLPVVEKDKLIGIITTNDVMKAFLDVMGAAAEGSTRVDFILEGEEHGLTEASRIVNREGGEILGVGTYREKIGDNPVCYLRLLSGNAEKIAKSLRSGGFDVLGVHKIAGETKG
ncbi:MAG TPA: CBS domain-containing protein [Candidatus Binatia bacterium]